MKAIFALLLLLALAVRAIVPAGYMPTQGAKGLVISLCTGEGARQMVLAVPQSDAGDDQQDHERKPLLPCAFMALAAPALGGSEPAIISAPDRLLREVALPPPVAISHSVFAYVRPPLRGPPLAG
jgi:hypothetical protein